MKVLMITADRGLLKEGSNAWERLQLQRNAVTQLDVVYFGRGALLNVLSIRGTYDVVTAQDPLWRGLVAWCVAKKVHAKFNVQVHMDLSTLSLIRHILAQIILRYADSVRVVSEKIKVQVEKMEVKAKISVLPVFVDVQRFHSVARREHAGKNILWMGRFEGEKNPLQAIAVLKEVLKTVPDARLVMLGAGDMKEQIAENGVGLPVDLPGWQDPIEYLEVADVVVCTSKYESWGASIVEALASGVPVVAPDVGIANEAGAIVVSREKLAEAVIEVLKSGERGVLKLSLLPAEAWAVQWRQTLV